MVEAICGAGRKLAFTIEGTNIIVASMDGITSFYPHIIGQAGVSLSEITKQAEACCRCVRATSRICDASLQTFQHPEPVLPIFLAQNHITGA